MSKDVLFKINIPDGQVAVRIEFWGLSNSSAANWAYLCYLANPALPTPIVAVEGGQTVDGITGRDIMDNEAIKALAYPFSPSPVQAETKPVAVIEDPLGWYYELSFLYDGETTKWVPTSSCIPLPKPTSNRMTRPRTKASRTLWTNPNLPLSSKWKAIPPFRQSITMPRCIISWDNL